MFDKIRSALLVNVRLHKMNAKDSGAFCVDRSLQSNPHLAYTTDIEGNGLDYFYFIAQPDCPID